MVAENNKRIAKNTVFLYIRMLLVMGVSLFTSRVVLQVLGIDDYGVYNVIGGVVVLFTFINQAMATGTQRFITFEMGKADGDVSSIFSACLTIHLIMVLIVLILGETIGLWFINSKMNFAPERMVAVNWVYQLTLISCSFSIIRFPFDALVLAYERMNFYAYNSIVEVSLKLLIVYALLVFPGDRLIVYSGLMTAVVALITIWYMFFCHRNMRDVRPKIVKDKSLFKELISFSGWAVFGSAANLGYQQGANVIVNIFYGVAVNAAVGISNQVYGAVTQFVNGFQQAVNPQLIKSEASHDASRQNSLIEKSSKFSFFIMLIIAFPLLFNIDYILDLWLGEVPAYTSSICVFVIIGALIESLSGPLWVTIFATGRIKLYQIVISSLLILNIPVSIALGYMNLPPWSIYIARCVIFCFALVVRLLFLRRQTSFSISGFIKAVIIRVLLVSAVIILIGHFYQVLTPRPVSVMVFLWHSVVLACIALATIFMLGFSRTERNLIVKESYTFLRNKIR